MMHSVLAGKMTKEVIAKKMEFMHYIWWIQYGTALIAVTIQLLFVAICLYLGFKFANI
jgi:hypothetical protein